MSLRDLNPLEDVRWSTFLKANRAATVFHSSEWMRALSETYGLECRVLASIGSDSQVCGGVPYCIADSWLTGTRVVSLPFSDYCPPLADTTTECGQLISSLRQIAVLNKARAAELRGCGLQEDPRRHGFEPSARYVRHTIDLTAGMAAVESNYHSDCVRRKIRKARQHGVRVVPSSGCDAVSTFYSLMVRTRRRHGYPPAPKRWFVNVAIMVPGAEMLLAYYREEVIGGVMTLRWNDTVFYKYGVSHEQYHYLGTMPLLYSEMIRRGVETGALELDLGRTEMSNSGLAVFKDRFGATRKLETYWKSGQVSNANGNASSFVAKCGRMVLSHAPLQVLPVIGNLLYRHCA